MVQDRCPAHALKHPGAGHLQDIGEWQLVGEYVGIIKTGSELDKGAL